MNPNILEDKTEKSEIKGKNTKSDLQNGSEIAYLKDKNLFTNENEEEEEKKKNKYENYDIKKLDLFAEIKTLDQINEIKILNDKRILTISNDSISIYNPKNNFKRDISKEFNFSINTILNMNDGFLLIFFDKSFISDVISIYEMKEEELLHKNSYNLSGFSEQKKYFKITENEIAFCGQIIIKIQIYSYNNGDIKKRKMIMIKREEIKDYFAVNENEIGYYLQETGFFGKNYIVFHDVNKLEEKASIKVGSYSNFIPRLLNNNYLIVGCDLKIKLIDLKNYTVIDEYSFDSNIINLLVLNEKLFLANKDNDFGIYQFALNKYHQIIKVNYKSKSTDGKNNNLIAYPGNKLIFAINNVLFILGEENEKKE